MSIKLATISNCHLDLNKEHKTTCCPTTCSNFLRYTEEPPAQEVGLQIFLSGLRHPQMLAKRTHQIPMLSVG
jgi:hypothetical protein